MARISDRKFLGKVNYKDVIYFSEILEKRSKPSKKIENNLTNHNK